MGNKFKIGDTIRYKGDKGKPIHIIGITNNSYRVYGTNESTLPFEDEESFELLKTLDDLF